MIAVDHEGKSKKVFDQLFYFTTFVYCIFSICLYLLFNDFITIWLGKKYLLSNLVVFSIVLHFYVNGTQFAAFTYRQTSGLFMQYRWSPVASATLNIVLSIVWAKSIGLAGVFFATSVSRIVTAGWIDPLIIHKNVFKEKVGNYYLKYIFRFIKVMCFGVICYYASSFIVVNNILMFIVKGLFISILSGTLFIITSLYTHEFKELKSIGLNLLKRK